MSVKTVEKDAAHLFENGWHPWVRGSELWLWNMGTDELRPICWFLDEVHGPDYAHACWWRLLDICVAMNGTNRASRRANRTRA